MKPFKTRVAAMSAVVGSLVLFGSGLASASPAAVGDVSDGAAATSSWQDCAVKVGTDGPEWMVSAADAPCTIFFAGGGDDVIIGGPGDDFIFGEGGDDKIAGGGGDDTIWGGQGNDLLAGEAGADQIWGMNGDDVVKVRDLATVDYADGGSGSDCAVIDDGDGYKNFEMVWHGTVTADGCNGWND